MNNNFLFVALALLSGALIPIQAATNSRLTKFTGSPAVTAVIVFLAGFAALLVFLLIKKTPLPSLQTIQKAPVYSFIGGLIVAFYVVIITFLVPKLGIGSAIGLIVTGQIVASVVIDHYGFFNLLPRRLDVIRILGVILMVAGVYLIMRQRNL